MCIARVAKPKRLDIFIETAKLLPQYAFIWIGNTNEIESPLPNIFFMGNIPYAGIYNQLVDIFMLSSDFEGLPIVILEAMAYGKPIVASKVGGINEIVIDGKNGYVVNNIPDIFADKIKYILDDSDRCHDFGTYSRKFFNENLTVNKMVNKYVDIYMS
ncbi:glycosyltransferase [Bacteroides fragilis]